jgi:hypothetical protein
MIKKVTAIEFGEKHGSCSEAMTWRRSLPKGATQADAWLACERGEWLFWQLLHGLTAEEYDALRPAIKRASERIAQRAVLRAHLACVDVGIEIPEWEVWAFEYVTGSAARSAWSPSLTRRKYKTLSPCLVKIQEVGRRRGQVLPALFHGTVPTHEEHPPWLKLASHLQEPRRE